jgi:hypothetical protein
MKFTSFARFFGGRKVRKTAKGQRPRAAKPRTHLHLESLEERAVPAILGINDVSTVEGNSGTHNALFTVTLDAPISQNVTVNYSTANGTGTAGSDYQGATGTVSIPAGQITTTIPVTVFGNTVDQINRTFFVNLSNPVNASVGRGQGVGTIIDDDGPRIAINNVSVNEGNSGTTPATFTVSLTKASPQDVTINYATADSTGHAGSDYQATSGTLTIPAGQTTGTLTVPVIGNTIDQVNRVFLVNISNPTHGFIGTGTGVGNIIDDDGPAITINNVSVLEGNLGTTTPAVFTVSLAAVSPQDVRVNYATADGIVNPATANLDYLSTSGTVTIPAGATSAKITVLVKGDNLIELNETFAVNLSNPSHGSLATAGGTATIIDDDGPAKVSINNIQKLEGNSGTSGFVFTVALDSAAPQDVNISYTTQDGTALAGTDYTPISGVLTIPKGITQATLTVPVIGNTVDQLNRTFSMVLSNISGAAFANGQSTETGTATILDDDGPAITIDDQSAPEGNTGTSPMTFTVHLSAASPKDTSVAYATSDGTGKAGVDYQTTSGTLTIPAGQLTGTLAVPIIGNILQQPNRTFFVNLSNPSFGATIADNQAKGTILDDDGPNISISPATLSIGDTTVLEGNSGLTNAVFTVYLSFPLPQDVTVQYATADGTSRAVDNDYVPQSGTLTIAAGQTFGTVVVPVVADLKIENDKSFFLNLSNAIGAGLSRTQGVATIIDDDGTPALTISDQTTLEGSGGTQNSFFTVFLSNPSTQDVTVDYTTVDGTGANGAKAGIDYTATSGKLTIPAGQTFKTIPVPIIGNLSTQANRTFSVVISNPINATLAKDTGAGTIVDDDGTTTSLTVGDVSLFEGNGPGNPTATFNIYLSKAAAAPIQVQIKTTDGTATGGSDYTAVPLTTITIPAGATLVPVNVTVTADTLLEGNETFFLDLSNPSAGVTLARARGTGTIVDDDLSSQLSVSDVTVVEGDAGTTDAVFTVYLPIANSNAVTVDYSTADGSALVSDNDYVPASGTLTIPAGQTSATFTIAVNGDQVQELNENFFVNLRNPKFATLARAQGTGTILDDDRSPLLSNNVVQVLEGDSSTQNFASLRINLSSPNATDVTIHYQTVDGTAIGGVDFAKMAGTIIIPAGDTSATLRIPIIGNTIDQANRSFFVQLSNPTGGATLGNGTQVQVTIVDDDGPTISISNVSAIEGNSGHTPLNFIVSLSAPSPQAISVNYATADGSGTALNDYVATSGKLTILPGQTSGTITVQANGNTVDQANRTFFVVLSKPVNAVLPPGTEGIGTIIDDDGPTLSISSVSILEGDTGTRPAVFRVTVSGGGNPDGTSPKPVSVRYATFDGTATGGLDYERAAGNIMIPANADHADITVPVIGDTLPEPNETFFVNLSNPVNATVLSGTGTGTIIDDDSVPVVSINSVTVIEGTGVTTPATLTLTLNHPSSQDIVVQYYTQDGTAHATIDPGTGLPESDFVGIDQANPQSVRFAAGTTTATVTVGVNGDSKVEPTENFFVVLQAPPGVNPARVVVPAGTRGTVTIVDDDGPQISVGDSSVIEGNVGTRSMAFTVYLSGTLDVPVSMQYFTLDTSVRPIPPAPFIETGTAVVNKDYLGIPFGQPQTLTIPAGAVTGTITIPIIGDVLQEPNETFDLYLMNPVNSTIARFHAIGTIIDDDGETVSVGDVSQVEGNSGLTNFNFLVSLAAPTPVPVTVDYATSDATATGSIDYRPTSGTLTIPAGATSAVIAVPVVGDTIQEGNETFILTLSNPTNASLARPVGVGTIIDDDGAASISLSDVSVLEGNSGVTNANFLVQLSNVSSQNVSFNYSTVDGSATAANNDYIPITNGTVTIPAGQTSAIISVAVVGDTNFEPNETFTVSLSNPINATIARGTATGTIVNDDGLRISIGDATLQEGNSGTSNMIFTVYLSAATSRAVNVDYTTVGGTAVPNIDFFPESSATNGPLTIPAGQTTGTIVVPIIGNSLIQANRNFTVQLSNPVNGSLLRTLGTGTIIDDDGLRINVGDAALTTTEGPLNGTSIATFRVYLTGFSPAPVSFIMSTSDGTGVAGVDYIPVPATPVTIPAGSRFLDVPVKIIGNNLAQPDRNFFLNVSNASPNATIVRSQGSATIIDDDGAARFVVADVTQLEGNPGDANVEDFAVFLTGPSPSWPTPVTVEYSTNPGSASDPQDYIGQAGTLTFAPGTFQQHVIVPIQPDTLQEANEQFTLVLNNVKPAGTVPISRTGTGTIIDDDGVNVSVGDITVQEGNSGTTNATFTVFVNQPLFQDLTVDVSTANGTAIAGIDYQPVNTSVTIAAGTFSTTVTVPINGNTTPQPNRDFTLNVANPRIGVIPYGTVVRPAGTGTIIDDDGVPDITVGDLGVIEGNSGLTPAAVGVFLSFPVQTAVNIQYATAVGGINPATPDVDFQSSSGVVTIPFGQLSAAIPLNVIGDVLPEGNETFLVNISNPSLTTATVVRPTGTVTIIDDDGAPSLAISDVTVVEGNLGQTTNAVFTVSLSIPTSVPVTFTYQTTGGTATGNVDYTAIPPTQATIPVGQTSTTITVAVIGDNIPEPNETFFVRLSGPVNASIGRGNGLGTILDDDLVPTLTVGDVAVIEGNTNSNPQSVALFPVYLSFPSNKDITVKFDTADGTANNGLDYVKTSGVITIPANTVPVPGQPYTFIAVQIIGDNKPDGPFGTTRNETFTVNLSNPVNVLTPKTTATGTIIDDDAPQPQTTISGTFITDTSVLEGNSGLTPVTFTVRLTEPSPQAVTILYHTQPIGANPATPNVDYVDIPNGSLTIPSGQTVGTITVNVIGNTIDQVDRTFSVVLDSATNAIITSGVNIGIATIVDDDGPTLSLTALTPTVPEGNTGTTPAVFRIAVSGGGNADSTSPKTIFVHYTTVDGTATGGLDYASLAGTLIIPANTAFVDVTALVIGDTIKEADETFFLNLSNPTSGTTLGASQAQVTILDDDNPTVTINQIAVLEGNSGTTNATLTVTLDSPTPKDVTLFYHTAPGGLNPATPDSDFVNVTNGVAVIPAGQVQGTITVLVKGDTLDEPNETFFVVFDSGQNVIIAPPGQGQVTILNDDGPQVSVQTLTPTVVEGDSGTTLANFRVNVSGGGNGDGTSPNPVTVQYTTVDGTATGGLDYATISGTLIIPANTPSVDIAVPIIGDTIKEADETFFLKISNPSTGTTIKKDPITQLPLDTAQVVILDDDPTPKISVSDISVAEGNSGLTNFVFTISLTNASTLPISVNYSTADGTARTADSDYVSASGTATIQPLQLSTTITISVVGDVRNESDETFFVNLTSPSNATIAKATGVGTILNDDALPTISVQDASVLEGDSGNTSMVFTVTLSAVSGQDVTVNYSTADGTGPNGAVANVDYVPSSNPLVIPAGQTSAQFQIAVIGNTIQQQDRTFFVNLSAPSNGTLARAQATGTILDDDGPNVTIGDVQLAEGNSGLTAFVFPVSLSFPSLRDTTIFFSTADGTAKVANNDYQAKTSSLFIPAGVTSGNITALVVGDTVAEANETFFVNLTSAQGGARITQGVGTGTILNDDALPGLTVANNGPVQEGDNGSTNTVTFTVSLSTISGQDVSFDYTTVDGSGVANTDYVPVSGTLTITAGQLTATPIAVQIIGNTVDQLNRTFSLSLTSATNALIVPPGSSTATIVDDDGPAITIGDTTVQEGNNPGGPFNNALFQVTLAAASPQDVTVNFSTADGSGVAGTDYQSNSGSITIPAGSTTGVISIPVIGNTADQANRTFLVNIAGATHGRITRSAGTATILDDDGPGVTINDITVAEGNSGNSNATFTLTLAKISAQVVSVTFVTADGTGHAGVDYVATSGTVNIPIGQTKATFTVPVIGNTLTQPNRTFFVNLTSVSHGSLTKTQGQATILDDDPAGTIVFSQTGFNVKENAGSVTVTVLRVGGTSSGVTVTFAASDGTAHSGVNFTGGTQTLIFAAGQTSQTVTLPILDDHVVTARLQASLTLTNPTGGATLGVPSTAVLNISDTDGTATQHFVAQLYLDVLGRPVDPAGLAFFSNGLDTGKFSRTQVAQSLLASPEYRMDVVNGVYRFILHRGADSSGQTFWMNYLAGGGATETMEAALSGSQEYFVNRGGNNNAGFLQALYTDALHRNVDQGALAFFGNALATGKTSATAVSTIIFNSDEFHGHLVNFPAPHVDNPFENLVVHGYYQHYLRRDADAASLNAYVQFMRNGLRDETVIALLAGSDEYFRLTQ